MPGTYTWGQVWILYGLYVVVNILLITALALVMEGQALSLTLMEGQALALTFASNSALEDWPHPK